MTSRIRLNHKGVSEILKSAPMAAEVKATAEKVAQNVRDQGIKVGDRDGGPHEYDLPVTVTMVTTDRAHALVTIAHPSGESVQAKHGSLTKAAAQAGLDVRGKK
jgi:hypothetical protein